VYSTGTTDVGSSALTKFNSIEFALNTNASTTAMNLLNVKVDTGTVSGVTLTSVAASQVEIPKVFALNQNYPNPFNPTTTIQYDLPMNSHVTLTVYDLLGKAVARLVDKDQSANKYSVEFDASHLSSGVYFYRIDVRSENGSKNLTSVKKLMLMK